MFLLSNFVRNSRKRETAVAMQRSWEVSCKCSFGISEANNSKKRETKNIQEAKTQKNGHT
jgi:hypothetical protein